MNPINADEKVGRSGRGGRYMCDRCRRSKNGKKCTKPDPFKPCLRCQKRGFTDCIQKWPEKKKVCPTDLLVINNEPVFQNETHAIAATEPLVGPTEFSQFEKPQFSSEQLVNGTSIFPQSQDSLLSQSYGPSYDVQTLQRTLLDSMHAQETPVCPEGFDYDVICPFFSRHLSPLAAVKIEEHLRLEEHSHQPDANPIVNSQGFVFKFPSSGNRWGLMLWRESDMEILKLFHIDYIGFLSTLTHYSRGKQNTSAGKQSWQAAISWQVNSVDNLKTLWIAASYLTWTPLVRATNQELRNNRSPFILAAYSDLLFSIRLPVEETLQILDTAMPVFMQISKSGEFALENGGKISFSHGWLDLK